MREADKQLNERMRQQFGAVSRQQGITAGLGPGPWRRRVASGELVMVTDHVAVAPATADTWERRVMVGLLEGGPHSALSIEPALAFYGVPGCSRDPIHISRPRVAYRGKHESIVWHHPRLLPAHHVLQVNGLRVTTPARALADLAGVKDVHPKRVERAIETAWAARLVNRSLLDQMATDWCERGRRGSTFLHEY